MWIEILNKSFEETVEIKRNQPLGFLAIEPENLNFRYETANKKKRKFKMKRVYREHTKRKQKRQHGSSLNQCDFSYASRDVINQAAKVAFGVIKVQTIPMLLQQTG